MANKEKKVNIIFHPGNSIEGYFRYLNKHMIEVEKSLPKDYQPDYLLFLPIGKGFVLNAKALIGSSKKTIKDILNEYENKRVSDTGIPIVKGIHYEKPESCKDLRSIVLAATTSNGPWFLDGLRRDDLGKVIVEYDPSHRWAVKEASAYFLKMPLKNGKPDITSCFNDRDLRYLSIFIAKKDNGETKYYSLES